MRGCGFFPYELQFTKQKGSYVFPNCFLSLIKLLHKYINVQSFKITLDAGVLTVTWNPITQVERIVISRPGTE